MVGPGSSQHAPLPLPARKGPSGCLVAALVVGGIALLAGVVVIILAAKLWGFFTPEESASLPWHRVVSADARLSPKMDPQLSSVQRMRLEAEGMKIDAPGYLQDADAHFHVVGVRRSIRWSDAASVAQGG